MLAWYSQRRPGRVIWCIIAGLGMTWWCAVEQPWRPFKDPGGGLTLVQWTMSHDKTDRDAHARVIVDLNADITILTHGYGVRGTDRIQDWLGPDLHPYKYGHFTVLTRLPVRQLRSIAAAQNIHLVQIEIDTTESLGRPLRLIAVDLPSNPLRSRMRMAEVSKEWLEKRHAHGPDLALGDFNMRLGSAAMKTMFPELQDAWHSSGVGWGPTFPRTFPIYHIDHVMIADWLHAISSRTINPGIGRHRLQLVRLQAK
jgi:hypothetical protein